jgi:hypothetical protein
MEKQIIEIAKSAIKKSIIDELTGYNKPLSKLTNEVIQTHSAALKVIINTGVEELLNADDFKIAIKEALHDKLARLLISKMGGELEKKVNELKQDATSRARITLAVHKVIEDILKEKIS